MVNEKPNGTTTLVHDAHKGSLSRFDLRKGLMVPTWLTFATVPSSALAILVITGWYFGAMALLLIELLLALSSVAVGAFMGFLFGSPRSDTVNVSPGTDGKRSLLKYIPNTNLDQVSDWLTKIIVGVGLIEMGQVAAHLERMGDFVQSSIQTAPTFTSLLSQIVVILFGSVGFLGSFLWARLYYGPLQTAVDNDVIKELEAKVDRIDLKVDETTSKTDEVDLVTKLLARGDIGSAEPPALPAGSKAVSPETSITQWPPEVQENFNKFLKAPAVWESDPGRESFKSAKMESQGYRITGEIDSKLSRALILRVEVSRIDGGPFEGGVAFLLHPTLSPRVKYATPQEGVASIKFYAEGWFTVVAILGDGAVVALDLRTIAGVPTWFKEN